MPIINYSAELIFESEADKKKLVDTLKMAAAVFNECSAIHFGSPKNSIKDLHGKAYRVLREKFPKMQSNTIIQIERHCLSRYKKAKTMKHSVKKPHRIKKPMIQLCKQTYLNRDGWRFSTIEGRIPAKLKTYPKLDELLSNYKLGSPILYIRGNKILIRLPFDIPEPPVKINKVCGVDFGLRRPAATSEGKIFVDKAYAARKRKIRYLRRSLLSRGTRSAKRHLKEILGKEHRMTLDMCHNLTKKIIFSTDCNGIAIEDLSNLKKNKASGIRKYKKLKKLAQMPIYTLRTILSYKVLLYQKRLIVVNPTFTSQIDHQTGRRSGVRKGCRYITRKGLVYDADVNAAINIAKRSKKPISKGNFLDGQPTRINQIAG